MRDLDLKPVRYADALPFFSKAELGKLVRYRSVAREKKLTVQFALNCMLPEFRDKPLEILTHLTGHESEGSLFAELARRNWAYALSSGSSHLVDNLSILQIIIRLTDEGF